MGRARVLISRRRLVALYVERGLSIRECAVELGVGRGTIERALPALGIAVREADEAADLRRVTTPSPTVAGCRARCGSAEGPVCTSCRMDAELAAGRGRCAWRGCQQGGQGGWCYAHRKRIEGLIA